MTPRRPTKWVPDSAYSDGTRLPAGVTTMAGPCARASAGPMREWTAQSLPGRPRASVSPRVGRREGVGYLKELALALRRFVGDDPGHVVACGGPDVVGRQGARRAGPHEIVGQEMMRTVVAARTIHQLGRQAAKWDGRGPSPSRNRAACCPWAPRPLFLVAFRNRNAPQEVIEGG